MLPSPSSAVDAAWLVWALSWFAAALWADRAVKRPSFGTEFLYRAITVAGVILLFRFGRRSADAKLWTVSEPAGWALAAASVLGFLFCWWARLHLGRLWSGWVTKKADHRIVDTGPYGVVRHPIYTGLIAAAFATAALKGTAQALGGAALMTLGFWIKARLEERFLGAELGADAYAAYRRRVPMLIPFLLSFMILAALAAPAGAQERGAGLAAMLGRAEPGVETRATALPGAAGGTPSMVSEEAHGSYVVARSSASEWNVIGKAAAVELGRAPVVIPQSGFVVPTKLWSVQAGANYSRVLGDRRGWGIGGGVGSASDVPFHSLHETDLSLAARYELPSRERNSWVFLLNYSNNRTFLNNVPLPGFAYVIREPDRGLTAVVGFPFALVRYKPDEDWTLSASLFGGSNYTLEAARRVKPVTLYARLAREPQQWLRAGRSNSSDRLIYDEKDFRVGARAPVGAGFSLDGSLGWSFDRRFSEALDANRSAPRAALRNAAIASLALSWRP